MTNKFIDDIIDQEFHRVTITDCDFSIANGAMGVALFMIWYGQKYDKSKYINDGFLIIETRCLNMSAGDPLDFHKGQVGIAMGILWLYLSKKLQTPISEVLRQVDDNIFKNTIARFYRIEKKHIGTLIDIACYLALRLKHKSFDKIDERIYSKLLLKIINIIYPNFYEELVREPFPGGYSYNLPRFLLLLACSVGNNFDARINRIIEEIQPNVLAQIPYMVSNRLALANAINILSRQVQTHDRWVKHSSLLRQSIDSNDIECEYKTYQMSLYNGLGWLALQLLVQKHYKFETKPALFEAARTKLNNSCFSSIKYDELVERNFVGLYGILGFIFISLNFNNSYEE